MSASPLFLPTGDLISYKRHSLTLCDVQVAIYQSKHPEFAANILTWMATGARARALSLSLFLTIFAGGIGALSLSFSFFLSHSLPLRPSVLPLSPAPSLSLSSLSAEL